MSTVSKDLEALAIALKTEEEGYEFFSKVAKEAENEFIKKIFEQLAKDELLHKELIKRFYTQLKEKSNWSELTEEDRQATTFRKEMRTIFSHALEQAKAGTFQIDENDVEIYRKAAQFERDGVELYTRLYNETDDEKAKRFYAFLRDMEQDHMDVLDNTLQYLENPDNWYLLQEGWTLDD